MVRNTVWRGKATPRGWRPITTKILFEYKFNQAGDIERYMCQLVSMGCRQRPGRDYHETWAPLPTAATTRALLGTAAAHGWHVHHIDVKKAYLNALMEVDVYIIVPDGCDDAGEEALLLKTMYGTKQAGRLLGAHLQSTLTGEGAVRSEGDRCLYLIKEDGVQAWIEVHVDDILAASRDLEAIFKVKQMVTRHVDVRALGEVTDVLGMEVKWDRVAKTVSMGNPRHTAGLLADFGMEDCRPNATPIVPGTGMGMGEALSEGNRFAELVGSVLHLCNQTLADLAFAVVRLARCMANATDGAMVAAKALLRYLSGSNGMGLVFGGVDPLNGWVDSDFAGDLATRKSTTGFLFIMNGGAISWRSRLQRLVTSSTADAEFLAAAEAVKESLWLRGLAGGLGEDEGPVTLGVDNQTCIDLASNAASTSRTKHVDICDHVVRDCVARGEVFLEYVPTGERPADGLTKALSTPAFRAFRDAVGVGELDR